MAAAHARARLPFSLLRILLASLAAVVVVAGAAHSAPVYDTSALGELTGTRDVHVSVGPPGVGGLTGFNAYADATIDFTVDWVITLGPSVHYEYTFTGLNGSGQFMDISHWTLDLSDDCMESSGCVTNAKVNGAAIAAEDLVYGDIDGIIGAIKFDIGGGEGVVFEFDSNRAPVYGHLAVKNGGGSGTCPTPGGTSAVCNNGMIAASENILDYVARPNGIIPEPSTITLVGLGLAGVAFVGRRRRVDG